MSEKTARDFMIVLALRARGRTNERENLSRAWYRTTPSDMRRRNNGSTCFCQASSIKKGGRSGCNETETNEPPGWCIYAAVALVAVGCYLNALDCDFVHDDIPAVVRNRDVIGEASWSSVLNDDFWGTPMESINSHKSYRPFTTLTFR